MNKEYLDLAIAKGAYLNDCSGSMIPIQMIIKKHPVGDFEPYTSGEFSKYPNILETGLPQRN